VSAYLTSVTQPDTADIGVLHAFDVTLSGPPRAMRRRMTSSLARTAHSGIVRTLVQSTLGILGLLGASGCSTTLAASPTEPERVAVQTVVAEQRPVARTLRLTGTLLANQETRLASDGTGKVLATYVERGDRVLRGQALARLDARAQAFQNIEAEAQTAALDAQARTETLDCARAERLFSAGAISASERDRYLGACTSQSHSARAARARANLSAKALGDSIIRAPFDGVVAERNISVGEFVAAGASVATVVDASRLRLELQVPEAALAAVRDGGEVEFSVAAYPDRSFRGRISHVGPVVRRQSRDQLVEASVDNEDGALRPGMFAVARLSVGSDDLPIVPASAVGGSAESPRVFVVNGDRVEERVVLARAQSEGEIALAKGVNPGERVVAPLTDAVRDGVRVR
jgi:membrane fusion protein (multidrug efflux system)